MTEKFNVVELFSGIGAQAKSLKKISKNHDIDIDFVGTCEWDIHPIIAYFLLHEGKISEIKTIKQSKEELLGELKLKNLTFDGKKPISYNFLSSFTYDFLKLLYLSIQKTNNFVDITKLTASQLPNDIDLLTYSFPCQDLSNIGSLHRSSKGIDRDAKNRSSLLWEVERLLNELSKSKKKLPKTLLMENVSSINAPRHKHNFEVWQKFLESLGYYNKVYKLYAPKFGIPQNRTRVFMLSFLTNKKRSLLESYFKTNNLEEIQEEKGNLADFINTTDKKLRSEWLEAQPNNTPSRKVIWTQNPQLYKDGKFQSMANTLTTKQDRHPNSGNIQFKGNPQKADYRFLTPRECFLLMGFDNKDYEVLSNHQIYTRKNYKLFNRDVFYKLTGNSIVVNMLDRVFEQIIEVNKIINQ